MSRISFVKRERKKRTGGGVFVFFARYPEIDGCDKINAFYAALAENAENAAEKSTGENKRISFRMTPRIRYEDDERADITFDIISSENGALKVYRRIAQSWNLKDETLFPPAKRGAETFWNGEYFVEIKNLFGKDKKRRMSEYIEEFPAKTAKRRVFRQRRRID